MRYSSSEKAEIIQLVGEQPPTPEAHAATAEYLKVHMI